MDLKPASEQPTPFERLVCELIKTQDYVSVSQDEVTFFLNDWSVTLDKKGKWTIG